MDVWKPKYFQARTLEWLPTGITVQGHSVVINYLRKSELREAFAVTQNAAQHSLNVGVDEVVWDSFEDGTLLLSEAFAIRKRYSSKIVGLIIIGPCMHCRTMAPCVASFDIFLTTELKEMGKDIYKKLVKLAAEIARGQDLGYIGVMTSVFTTCIDMLVDLKELDFGIVACLPLAGHLVNRNNLDSYLLYKTFNTHASPKKTRSFQDLQIMADRLCDDLPLPEHDTTARQVIPDLPIRYTFQKARLRTIWRNATNTDAKKVYDQISAAASTGSGYSLDEQPTFNFFFHFMFKSQYGFIVEEEKTGDFVAYTCFDSYWPYRCVEPEVSEGSIIIDPKYRGRGISQEIAGLLFYMIAGLGFKGIMADTAIVNLAMNESQRKTGYMRVGIIPHSLTLGKQGFVDSVYSYKTLEGYCSFSEKIKTMSPLVVSKL